MTRHVVVVGGGISGLATAYHLTRPHGAGRAAPSPRVTVLESGPRLGGWVETRPFAGYPVDTGPESLLVRAPAVKALLTDLGLDDAVRAPASTGAYIWTRGALRPIPKSSVFGVPNALLPLVRSGLVGPLGMLRAGADLVLPRPRRLPPDPTIAQLLRPRFGGPVFRTMIEPLLGGISAGRADRLSARSAVPEVARMLEGRRSIYLALRGAAPRTGGGPALISLSGGLGRLVEALAEAVTAVPGNEIRTGAAVAQLRHGPDGGHHVRLETGQELAADEVVLAVPAHAAVPLLADLAPDAARVAASVPHASVAVVVLGYPASAFPEPLRGTGFLVPPAEGRLLVGSTWSTAKWPHLAEEDPPGPSDADRRSVVIRCMVGRDGAQRWAELDDDELVAAVRAELAEAMGLTEAPSHRLIRRMPDAMPQYTVGHADRLAELDRALAAVPGLRVTGAGYRGVGLASCITAAQALAAEMLAGAGLAQVRA